MLSFGVYLLTIAKSIGEKKNIEIWSGLKKVIGLKIRVEGKNNYTKGEKIKEKVYYTNRLDVCVR